MSTTVFSSIENINVLFNNLINSSNEALPLKYISKLVNDLTELLRIGIGLYDLEIRVGDGDNVKTFKAHSIILKARSLYFKTALSEDWIKRSKDNDIILFEKQNISPKIFEILLMYMYNGTVNIDGLDPYEIIELLEACDELNFNELIEDLEIHLITRENEWVQKNLAYIYRVSSKHQRSFSILYDNSVGIISDNPEIFLKSNGISLIEKSTLVSILKNNELIIREIDIWDCVIRWGIGQNEEISRKKNISELDKDDFKELKNLLCDIIPLIRFDVISPSDFYRKISPFKKVFDKEIYEELLQYHLSHDTWKPKFLHLKGPRAPGTRVKIGGGKLLNLHVGSLISSWIDRRDNGDLYNENNFPYDFELIIQGTRDGFSRAVFEKKCYDIQQTVAIMKIKGTGKIVGGYNPVCWNIKERSSEESYWIQTDKSFIFKIDGDQTTLSRVNTPKFAIYHDGLIVNQTMDNIKFKEKSISFYNLQLWNSVNNEPYCYYYHYGNYGGDLNLRNSNKYVHLVEELELYKIIKR